MGDTPVCTISAAGIFKPDFSTVMSWLVTKFQGIYGSDTYLGSDSQDGELVGLLSQTIDDCNTQAVVTYQAYSPTTAQGAGLSSNVKINNISRHVPNYSTAIVSIGGTYTTAVDSGVVEDQNGYQWSLPASVVIPYSGSIDVTATCTTLGAIPAPAGTITKIITQTLGWQSVTNASAASPGQPVEQDGALRLRQANSTMIPSQTGLAGLVGALLSLSGVKAVTPLENDTDLTDSNGLPPHSISLVITGGNAQDIANTMLLKKMDGVRTYGNTSAVATDPSGITRTMSWYTPTNVPINITVTLTPLSNYSTDVGSNIQAAMVNWINSMSPGALVSWSRSYTPANSVGISYDVTSITLGTTGAQASADIQLLFSQTPICSMSNVTIVA